MPAQSRNIILVVPGSCRVFHPREPTRTGYQNPIPVPIPNEQGTCRNWLPEQPGTLSRNSETSGRTLAAATYTKRFCYIRYIRYFEIHSTSMFKGAHYKFPYALTFSRPITVYKLHIFYIPSRTVTVLDNKKHFVTIATIVVMILKVTANRLITSEKAQ